MLLLQAKATDSDSDPDPDPGSRAPLSSDLLVGAPLFVLDLLRNGWRNENFALNERRRSGFDPGASTTESSDLEGVNAGGVFRFGVTKWNGFDMALAPV